MGGPFMRWYHDRAQDVFDLWAALCSYPVSAHAGYEPKGEAEACVNASPIASVPVTDRYCNQPSSDHLHGSSDFQERQRSTLPQYYGDASDPTLSIDSDSISSISGVSDRTLRHRTDFVGLQLQNAELKKPPQNQQEQVSELRTQLSSLRGEPSTTTTSHERLLSKVISTPNNSIQIPPFQPLFRILKLSRAPNSKLPIYQREDYNGQFYWTKESFVKEHHDVGDNYATGADTHTPADDAMSGILSACSMVAVQDDDDPVEAHGEDPPDYSELKAAGCSRAEIIKAIQKEKQQQYEILKTDLIYIGKARRKEKKQHHVHARRELGDYISSCLDVFECEREQARRSAVVARRRMAKSRTSVLSRKVTGFKLHHGIGISQPVKDVHLKQVDTKKKVAKEKKKIAKKK
ncbi:hypothetical protein SCLCIDRAFT_24390 [Scleroderma citrinum Foug A]|uniref:Uncharacterized protein n=1 Tax=Scleroderma citrinum Foug A TaxID=1036808 RepID=A0A0C2ZNX8_9AGAM|nr:hypothetical protein SCLCIDRAFT_24390 [Scleroderma citrinum Foug A]